MRSGAPRAAVDLTAGLVIAEIEQLTTQASIDLETAAAPEQDQKASPRNLRSERYLTPYGGSAAAAL